MHKGDSHPYLAGNFAPVQRTRPLTCCAWDGKIPTDLAGGQYVRNGGNPLTNDDLGRDAHWFDGDGMLSGVLFRRVGEKGTTVQPEFVNQYLLTDVYCYAKRASLLRPVLPSIATLINPVTSIIVVLWEVLRTIILVVLSRSTNRYPVKRISVANTHVLFHDGRGLATCESGPPLRFTLPGLETVDWFDGRDAENEASNAEPGFGGKGPLSFLREWTTGHPRVDPVTGELIAFHSSFSKPFVQYSIVQPAQGASASSRFNEAVPGVESPRMMHDFGVSRGHTIIMDLPLSLDPTNAMRGLPNLHYDATKRSRFGVFPRHAPRAVQWFDTSACLIFHTANCWDDVLPESGAHAAQTVVNLLACRMTSASTMFAAGNLPLPEIQPVAPGYAGEEQCRLYYYSFNLGSPVEEGRIVHQWALSAIPCEFPTVSPACTMQECRYIYATTASESFTVALGKATKIDYLAKFDAKSLIARGIAESPQPIEGCVDNRMVRQVYDSQDPDDPIKLFRLPKGWYAQEPRFVPRQEPEGEDDGWLLTYVFDESQLDEDGDCRDDATSELWIIDAKEMKEVVARVRLPQRVPYGLHGNWFSEQEIGSQRPYKRLREIGAPDQPCITSKVVTNLEQWIG